MIEFPVVSRSEETEAEFDVLLPFDTEGEVLPLTTESVGVALQNISAPPPGQFARVSYRIDDGQWWDLPVGALINLEIDCSRQTLRVKRYELSGNGRVRTTVVGVPSGLYAAGRLLSAEGAFDTLIFDAPLTSSLVPTTAGDPSFTFTRASTAYVSAVAPGGNAVDGEVLILCDANEARFAGARRISSGNWSDKYADGSPIPAATLLGVVAENAATNLCLQSQAFDNAAWVKTNATVTADLIAAPDGTVTADRIAATGALALVAQTITVSATPYAFSVYLKRLAGSGTVALVFDGTVTDVTAQINASTWSRVTATGTPAAGAKVFSIRVSTSGDSVYAWGAQVEAAPDASSYIPTTSAAATRNEDDLKYPWVSNIDGAVATTYTECYLPTTLAGAQQIMLVTPLAYQPQSYDTAKKLAIWSGGGDFFATANARIVGAVNKNASAWSGATASACLNGGAVATGSFSAFASLAYIGIGGDSDHKLLGSIRNVKFYATRLSDVQLQAMTAP